MGKGIGEVIDFSKFGSLEKLLRVTCLVCIKFEGQAKGESGIARKFVGGGDGEKWGVVVEVWTAHCVAGGHLWESKALAEFSLRWALSVAFKNKI